MAQEILIIGESGSGKSNSFENLDPKSTFIVNVGKKPMPFRGWKKNYTTLSKENPRGNYLESDNHSVIVSTLKHVDEHMPHIKTVIIDDFQYVMANEYMRRANERGFDKFTDIGLHAWEIATAGKDLRDDITFIMVGHAETATDLQGNRKLKFKTVGKLVDNVITMEGMFTIVLFTEVSPDPEGNIRHSFLTQSDGTTTGKSPKGMFNDIKIPNDIKYVIEEVNKYYN